MLHLLAATPPAGTPQPPGTLTFFFPLILLGIVFYFFIMRPQNAEKKRRAAMLSAIKKNDRVCTIGGIIGTVVNAKEDEVTLKVDESNNTKITFTRSAIARVLGADSTPASSPEGGTVRRP
jgi:preprotein translocase subunit YajC